LVAGGEGQLFSIIKDNVGRGVPVDALDNVTVRRHIAGNSNLDNAVNVTNVGYPVSSPPFPINVNALRSLSANDI
jgi:hypothetical protein